MGLKPEERKTTTKQNYPNNEKVLFLLIQNNGIKQRLEKAMLWNKQHPFINYFLFFLCVWNNFSLFSRYLQILPFPWTFSFRFHKRLGSENHPFTFIFLFAFPCFIWILLHFICKIFVLIFPFLSVVCDFYFFNYIFLVF